MALKSVTTTLATIQMRGGREEDFDPDQMTAREWAVFTDTKKVYICIRPGFVIRMATYEAFEQDMKAIERILVECQDVQSAVEKIAEIASAHGDRAEVYSSLSKSWAVGGTGTREGEDTDNSKYYSELSKMYKNAAETAIDLSKPSFTIDLNTGHLFYEGGRFDFEVQDGHLLWGMTL